MELHRALHAERAREQLQLLQVLLPEHRVRLPDDDEQRVRHAGCDGWKSLCARQHLLFCKRKLFSRPAYLQHVFNAFRGAQQTAAQQHKPAADPKCALEGRF